MKISELLTLLQQYRMPFNRWLWLGTALWALILISLNWLFHIYPTLSTTEKIYIIFAGILIMLPYQVATIRYFNLVLQRLKHFLSITRKNKTQLDGCSLIEHGEIGKLFKDVSLTAHALQSYFDRANATAEQQQLLSEAVKQSTNSIVITDLDAKILFVNTAFSLVSGYSAEEIIGKTPKIFQSGLTPAKTYLDIRRTLEQERCWHGELVNKCKNGDLISENISIMPIRNAQGQIWRFMAIKENITALKQAEQYIRILAFSDSVTRLANRNSLQLQFAKWQSIKFALLMVNINGFKQVNTQFGLVTGDLLLANFAERLRELFPEKSFIARLNSDEFITLLPYKTSTELTELVSTKLCGLNGKISAGVFHTYITCRLSACYYPSHGSSLSDLLNHADMAMRYAKQHNQDYCIFQPEMQLAYEKQLKQLDILRQELQHPNYLNIVLQPQFDATNLACIGAEVLLRLPHPEAEDSNIYSYILLAERFGLIKQLDLWVIKQSLLLLQRLQLQKFSGKLSINISAASFESSEFIDNLAAELIAHNIASNYLIIEITESALMSEPKKAINNANKLKQLGICLAIDDFGTGQSSLAYLQQFSVDILKIDKSFIKNIATNFKDQTIVETIIQLAKGLNLKTIAEGIENITQAELVQKIRCDYVQGYLYSKPVNIEHFVAHFSHIPPYPSL